MRGRPRADRHGETVASVERYAEAQRIVDEPSDRGFPVQHATIVGRDLRFVERVTGRRRFGRAALEGTGSALGVVGHALRRGRRDFSAIGTTEAASFDVAVHPDHAEQARRIVQQVRPAA